LDRGTEHGARGGGGADARGLRAAAALTVAIVVLLLAAPAALAQDAAGAGILFNTGTKVERVTFADDGSTAVNQMDVTLPSGTTGSPAGGGVCTSTQCPQPGMMCTPSSAQAASCTFNPAVQPGQSGEIDFSTAGNTPTSSGVTFHFAPGGGTQSVTAGPCGTIGASPSALPHAMVGTPYSQQLSGTGGATPYTFGYQGALPGGISLSTPGLLSGTPGAMTDGTFNFQLVVVDGDGCSAFPAPTYSLTVDPAAAKASVKISTRLGRAATQHAGGVASAIAVLPGEAVNDAATIYQQSAGPTPTGTVTFSVHAGAGCGGEPLVPPVTANIDYGPLGTRNETRPETILSATAKLAAGTYMVKAHYSGDSHYDAADGCDEEITVGGWFAKFDKDKYTALDNVGLTLAGSASSSDHAKKASDSGGRAASIPSRDRLARVEVAVQRTGPGSHRCEWLNGHGSFTTLKLDHGRCDRQLWLRAKGTTRWRYVIDRGLPVGSYVGYARATSRAGLAERTFSAKQHNKVPITVRHR
jgi:Putative Ig domain